MNLTRRRLFGVPFAIKAALGMKPRVDLRDDLVAAMGKMEARGLAAWLPANPNIYGVDRHPFRIVYTRAVGTGTVSAEAADADGIWRDIE